LYENFFQPNKRFEINVSVDRVGSDLRPLGNFSNKLVVRSNVDQLSNYLITDISVPSSGSYAITVTATGIGCFNSCSGISQFCSTFGTGRPFFRDIRAFVNVSGPQGTLNFNLPFVMCQ